jgi:hypothetical protein
LRSPDLFREKTPMSSTEYHTNTPEGNPPTRVDVWHNNSSCPEGKRISAANRREGRGVGKRLCEKC